MFSIKEIIAKSLVSAKNNMNIYRGCTHGCIYCDSRSEVYGKTYDFETIEVKVNAVELLEKELENTRKCLEVIEKYGFGAAVLTKSDLILRDIDLLKRINETSKCVVQMTLTTFDEALCKILEPNVCTTKRRFVVLKEMQKANIPTIVWLTPILPFINDNEENIRGILDYCKEAGVKGIVTFGMGMTLRYGNREYYCKKLDEHFPGLKKEYMRKYGTAYGLKSPHNAKLSKLIKGFCKENDMLYGEKEVFNYVWEFAPKDNQISLFD